MARLSFGFRACVGTCASALRATPLSGQVIGLKTVPLAAGDQFLIFPSQNRSFRAFDLQAGEVLWRDVLPAWVQVSPLTYQARPGARQFVVVAAGGREGMTSSLSDLVVAYALPLVVEQEVDR